MKTTILATLLLVPGLALAEPVARDVQTVAVTDTALYLTDADNRTWMAATSCDMAVNADDRIRIKYDAHRVSEGRKVRISVNGGHARRCSIESVAEVTVAYATRD